MNDTPRKKSPRAPSIALDEAAERALRIYDKERRHAAPVDAVAQHLGYKSANNGAALQVLASLRYYGLLERPEDAKMAVTKDVESFRFAPSEQLKDELQVKWLRTPPVFAELLDKYAEGLPSDATLRYDLIQRGFSPSTAESVLSVFKRSVEYTKFFERKAATIQADTESFHQDSDSPGSKTSTPSGAEIPPSRDALDDSRGGPMGNDRIPVRLTGGRRAWLEIPVPFYEADKKRLKDQIDLLLTEDEQGSEEP